MVAGSNGVEAQQGRPLQEPVELQVSVARDTGVRRPAALVTGNVGPDYVTFEFPREVEHVVGDAELLRYAAGVLDVGHRAAARVRGASPELHRGPDDLMAFSPHQSGSDGRVHPSGHGDQDAH